MRKASRNVLAEEGLPDLESLREWNEEIADIALSAAEVVKRLRSFARRDESPRTACRIEEVVAESLGLVAIELRKARVTVEASFSPASPPIAADRGANPAGLRQSLEQRGRGHAYRARGHAANYDQHVCCTRRRSKSLFPIAASACPPKSRRGFSSPT